MTARIIIGVVALAGVSISGLVAAVIWNDIVTRVNGRLPPADRFAPLGWGFQKSMRLSAEYRRLIPGGPLLRRHTAAFVALAACLLVAVACLAPSRG